ncbi:MAG: hypothetical protein DME19_21450 [Verrucomicrobia bacterium]|nr:MAG: hypothetical protein DME19_21450 [Verrucomicrobiota bacterium]
MLQGWWRIQLCPRAKALTTFVGETVGEEFEARVKSRRGPARLEPRAPPTFFCVAVFCSSFTVEPLRGGPAGAMGFRSFTRIWTASHGKNSNPQPVVS